MNKKVYFLKDLEENCVDAVIIAETSTSEDIRNAIYKLKEKEGYTWHDLLQSLPSDCILYDKWHSESIYY